MPKNTEGKELDAFEQEIEDIIKALDKEIKKRGSLPDSLHIDGAVEGYRYALELYRECRKDGTI